MRQKFEIKKNSDGTKLLILEHSQLEKEKYHFTCEESYDLEKVEKLAKQKDVDSLIRLIRTDNLFPVYQFTKILAEEIIGFLSNKETEPKEVLFDDLDYIEEKTPEEEEEEETKLEDIDDTLLLEEDEIDSEAIPKKLLSIGAEKETEEE